MMSTGTVTCTRCFAPLPVSHLNRLTPAPCPACRASAVTYVFPAFFKTLAAGQAGETILTEGEAGCFYHPGKRAVRPCDQCGRFLCSLCDLDMQGRHLCPNCLSSPQQREGMPQLENRRALYDSAALTLALLSIFFWPVAPVALGLAVYSFKQKSSLIPRTRARSWFALLIALAVLGGWIALFASIGWLR